MKEKSKKTHNINSLGDFMWILYSLLAAFFAGITSLFAKIGANKIDTKTATMIRSFIILIFSFIIVYFINNYIILTFYLQMKKGNLRYPF